MTTIANIELSPIAHKLQTFANYAEAGIVAKIEDVVGLRVQVVEMKPGKVTYHVVIDLDEGGARGLLSHGSEDEVISTLQAYGALRSF